MRRRVRAYESIKYRKDDQSDACASELARLGRGPFFEEQAVASGEVEPPEAKEKRGGGEKTGVSPAGGKNRADGQSEDGTYIIIPMDMLSPCESSESPIPGIDMSPSACADTAREERTRTPRAETRASEEGAILSSTKLGSRRRRADEWRERCWVVGETVCVLPRKRLS